MVISDKIELQNYKRNLIYFALQNNDSRLLEEINTLENNRYKPRKEALLVESKMNNTNRLKDFINLINVYFKGDFDINIACYLVSYYFDDHNIKDFRKMYKLSITEYKANKAKAYAKIKHSKELKKNVDDFFDSIKI